MKLRFAPSPTGYLHYGNFRTALVNWLFARKNGGKFLLRLDDTDRERSQKKYEEALLEDLSWMGLDFDDYQRQSDRLQRYEEVKQTLIQQERLYPCYESSEELDLKRKLRAAQGLPPLYDRSALSLSKQERETLEKGGRSPHWRFKLDEKDVSWEDLIRGPLHFKASALGDPVLFREDGMPVYTLASVVDDHDMGVTHIIRGEDHIANTAIQIQLLRALGCPDGSITFGHLSLLQGQEGEEISKRLGTGSLRGLREKGILPMALTSMLARLGTCEPVYPFSSVAPLIDSFDIKKFSRATPKFSTQELEHLNERLLHILPFEEAHPHMKGLAVDKEFWEGVRSNLRSLGDLPEWWKICRGSMITHILQEDEAFIGQAASLLSTTDSDQSGWEEEWLSGLKDLSARKGASFFRPLRQALTGQDHGPELKEILRLMGKGRALNRLEAAANLGKSKPILKLYNTLSRQKEDFYPIEPNHVKLYVCGPTVYDRVHLGNARAFVVFDVLFRVLKHLYPAVTYVRNITDVDDKIIQRSLEAGTSMATLTEDMTLSFHHDMSALNVLCPTYEPRATHYITSMQDMIGDLIQKGYAYAHQGHVLFDVGKDPTYGCLSRESSDSRIAGARVEVAPYKKSPEDFVLWKPSLASEVGWESPWGYGRPGWHIECSAMSGHLLGRRFDIHGGGIDLIFPHHENEIAQSRCAHEGEGPARYWVHNGHLQVSGRKMSKSLGNFLTPHDLLQQYSGEVIRVGLLSAHYRQPLDWGVETLPQAQKILDKFYAALQGSSITGVDAEISGGGGLETLLDDLNTPAAFSVMHRLVADINKSPSTEKKKVLQDRLKALGALLGILQESPEEWFQRRGDKDPELSSDKIEQLIKLRQECRLNKDFKQADEIRQLLDQKGIILEDGSESTGWKRSFPRKD